MRGQSLEAQTWLLELLKPGDTVYTIVTHVSRSGMMRHIRAFVIREDKPLDISWAVADLLGWAREKNHGGVKVAGCGMEQNGVALDLPRLRELSETLGEELRRLEADIYNNVGHQFNINSSQQLGQVLFEELHLPHGRKTKSGYSIR